MWGGSISRRLGIMGSRPLVGTPAIVGSHVLVRRLALATSVRLMGRLAIAVSITIVGRHVIVGLPPRLQLKCEVQVSPQLHFYPAVE